MSQSKISRTLKEMEITRKRLVRVPSERNSANTILARQVYARALTSISMSKLVYLDETGFNLHFNQSYGYSPKNVKAYMTFPANKGQKISLMAAISINGVVNF